MHNLLMFTRVRRAGLGAASFLAVMHAHPASAAPNPACLTSPVIALACSSQTAAKKGLGDLAANTVNATFVQPLADLIADAAQSLLNAFLKSWLDMSSMDLQQQGALKLYGITLSIGWLIGACLLMWQAIRTMVSGRGTPLLEAVTGLLITALVAAVGVTVTGMLMTGADEVSRWILGDLASNGVMSKELRAMLARAPGAEPVAPWLTIQICVLLILVLIIQLLVLFLRNAALPILAILLPIAAAGQIGGASTRQWLPRMVTAVIAVVVYKPMVSLIIVAAVAQWRDSTAISGLLYGLLMFALSVIAMPALMKVFAPIGVAVTGGGGSGSALLLAGNLLSRSGGGSAASAATAGRGAPGGDAAPVTAAQHAQRMDALAGSTPSAGKSTSPPSSPGTNVPSPAAQSEPTANPAPASGTAHGGPAAPSTVTSTPSTTTRAPTTAGTAPTSSATAAGTAGAAVPIAGAVAVGAQAVQHGVAVTAGQVGAAGDATTEGSPTTTSHPLERGSSSGGDGQLTIDDRT
ncbi:hypothetical protein [Microbispora sp. NBRC 16548]|uniref:hypothetical protein n=1 Tax=Microbispora sp. NBRC 16548 TaxID=3030994 RepID=UPI0024A20EEA|nr:hypothetical protein [Microbispora sp. NBRC 16548]GLX06789.1 hypothetical protein Misp03_37160 [Microbispora sp. NBRC 16548]